jgi:DNA-binding NtrC family response regulator
MSDMQAEQIDKATRILVIGKHDYILEKVESILRNGGFETEGALEEAAVIKMLMQNDFDALLIGGGVSPHSRISFLEYIQSYKPHIRVIEHFGGPATILDEVRQALPTA